MDSDRSIAGFSAKAEDKSREGKKVIRVFDLVSYDCLEPSISSWDTIEITRFVDARYAATRARNVEIGNVSSLWIVVIVLGLN